MTLEDEQLRFRRDTYLARRCREAIEGHLTDEHISERRNEAIANLVVRILKDMMIVRTTREICAAEPDCGKPCTDIEYANCGCHRCAALFNGFWFNRIEQFTTEQQTTISSQFDPLAGFLIDGGCVLPRELRPISCISGLCMGIKGETLLPYDKEI